MLFPTKVPITKQMIAKPAQIVFIPRVLLTLIHEKTIIINEAIIIIEGNRNNPTFELLSN